MTIPIDIKNMIKLKNYPLPNEYDNGNKWNMAKEGHIYIKFIGDKQHLLQNPDDGSFEIWVSNKNHASFGLIYKNTHLEFVGSATL